MFFKVKLAQSNSVLREAILTALEEDVDKTLIRTVISIKPKIKEILKNGIINSPTWQSLMGNSSIQNDLQAHFGLRPSEVHGKLNSILDTWLSGVNIKYNSTLGKYSISAKLSITAIQGNLQDVLSLDAAKVITNKGKSLEWLKWLMVEGDKVEIVKNFHIKMIESKRSRSGKALMIKGGRWSVPSIFAGTLEKNFITQLIDKLEDVIINTIQEEFISNIR